MSETLSAERALNLLRLSARVDPLLRQAVADVEAHIEALQAENAELRKPLLSYDEGGLPVELPAWTPVDAGRLEELEAAEAEVTTLRTALERIAQSAKALRYASIEDKALEALHGRE